MKHYILFHSFLVFVQTFDEDEPPITVLNCKNNVVKFHSLTPQFPPGGFASSDENLHCWHLIFTIYCILAIAMLSCLLQFSKGWITTCPAESSMSSASKVFSVRSTFHLKTAASKRWSPFSDVQLNLTSFCPLRCQAVIHTLAYWRYAAVQHGILARAPAFYVNIKAKLLISSDTYVHA